MGTGHSAEDASCENAIYPCHLAARNLAEPPWSSGQLGHGHGMERESCRLSHSPRDPLCRSSTGAQWDRLLPQLRGCPEAAVGPRRRDLGGAPSHRWSVYGRFTCSGFWLLPLPITGPAPYVSFLLHGPLPHLEARHEGALPTALTSGCLQTTRPLHPRRALRGAQHQCSRM